MYFKLTDLIEWGKAEARIHLDALQKGVSLENLTEQLQIRGELFEFDVLRDIRSPQLIELLKSWGKEPSEYNVEDIIEDIKTRKPKRKLIVEVKASQSFTNRHEAEIFLEEETKGQWQRIPSTYAGFLVANNKTELTIDQEIKRTAGLLERRYLRGLLEREFVPAEFTIDKITVTNVRKTPTQAYADIEVEIGKSKPGIKYSTVTEYWEKIIKPELESEHSPAQKRLKLAHFQKELTQAYSDQAGQQRLQTVQRAIKLLERMLETKMLAENNYAKIFTEIESDDPGLDKKESISIKGILEKYANARTLYQMWNHDNANKFYTEAFKFRLKNARIKTE